MKNTLKRISKSYKIPKYFNQLKLNVMTNKNQSFTLKTQCKKRQYKCLKRLKKKKTLFYVVGFNSYNHV